MYFKFRTDTLISKSDILSSRLILVFSLLVLVSACAGSKSTLTMGDSKDVYYNIDESLAPDAEIAMLIAPYLTAMKTRMNQVIAYSETDMERGQPEGVLGNMSADILRFRAIRELGKQVEIAVINNGGLRVPISQGNVTVGHIYELMPFENTISVLTLSGAQVLTLANQIAEYGGQPVSGMRFRMENGVARDILINYQPLDVERTYLVATNNFMADGGETLAVLWEPLDRIDLPVLIREAMIEYIRMKRNLNYELEQRVRITGGS
jgi:2',3'-cyclic-nucleotide 2'-phosphodiesterase (5'-nucleotidase family)